MPLFRLSHRRYTYTSMMAPQITMLATWNATPATSRLDPISIMLVSSDPDADDEMAPPAPWIPMEIQSVPTSTHGSSAGRRSENSGPYQRTRCLNVIDIAAATNVGPMTSVMF